MKTVSEVIREIERGSEDSEYSLSGMERRIVDALAAEGYVIVPKEPTEEMQREATSRGYSEDLGQCRWIWGAMIEAALKAREQP